MKMLLVMVLLLHVSQHALAGVVEVNEGAESVLLPCVYRGFLPEENPKVMWTRSDLSPRFVHQRGEEGDLEEQNQRYRGRTSMKPDALDSSDFSLSLRKPHLSDSSIYTCSFTDGVRERRVTDVELKVKEFSRRQDGDRGVSRVCQVLNNTAGFLLESTSGDVSEGDMWSLSPLWSSHHLLEVFTVLC
ncbi:butyrophilin-like protein 1 [Melanotaenia boesemani]|uniref:butyrophilin-like protein 1 n=1 Tax=Melanotaenia boesemani TaxID=1250792 RepID=UPI001C03F844|nr:butyrophilin-like protein 1 [Melanotaenia boesemani]